MAHFALTNVVLIILFYRSLIALSDLNFNKKS